MAEKSGLLFALPSAELKELLSKQAEYHTKRAEEKLALIPQLKQTCEAIKGQREGVQLAVLKSSSSAYKMDADEPVEDLQRDVDHHQTKARTYQFLADHVVTEKEYMLTYGELALLGFVRGLDGRY